MRREGKERAAFIAGLEAALRLAQKAAKNREHWASRSVEPGMNQHRWAATGSRDAVEAIFTGREIT